MKNALLALVCAISAGTVACGGETKRADDPSTVTTSISTDTSTTGARSTGAPTSATTPVDTNATTTPATTPDGRTTTPDDAFRGAKAPAASSVEPGAKVSDNPGAFHDTKDATNTKVNDRDRHGALTPTNQGGGNDRDITAAIRRAVVSDGSLSFTAKNVKIITTGGKVTLRGPVKSDQERSAIEAKAKSTAGVSEVDNQLEVKK